MALDDASPQNILVVGSITISSSPAELFLARFIGGTGTSSGVLDTTNFTANGYAPPTDLAGGKTIGYGVALQSTGKIVVSGVTNSAQEAFVARFTTGGLLDTFAQSGAACFGSGAPGAGTGYNVTQFGGLALTAGGSPYQIAVQSDDKVVIGGQAILTGPVTEFGIARFLADGSSLDNSTSVPVAGNIPFNGTGYNTSVISSPSLGNTLSMQQNGSFILAGTVGTGTTDFGVARYLGDIPQGAMNYYYNPSVGTSPGAPGFVINPTYATTTTPEITAICPAANGNIFVAGTSYNIDEISTNLVQLNSAGQIVTNYVNVGGCPTNDVIMNSVGQIVYVGIFNGSPQRGSLTYLDVDTGTPGSPGNFHDGNDVVESLSYSFCRVGQQKSGRYVVIGQAATTTTTGLLIAYNNVPALADHTQSICPPFGTGGAGSQVGYNTTLTANFTDLLIGQDDSIYVAFQNNAGSGAGAGHICIAKYLPDGSALDSTFHSSGIADTGLTVGSCGLPLITFDDDFSHILMTAA